MIPDPDFFMQCIQDGYDAMKDATLGVDAERTVATVARNYEQLAAKALDDVRAARARAERAVS